MGGLGPLVCSKLFFYKENPQAHISDTEIEHEINTLEKRKKLSGALAIGGSVVSLVAIAGLLGFGVYLVGALLAIATVAGFYSYCCKVAEGDLKEKKEDLVIAPTTLGTLPGAKKVEQQVRVLPKRNSLSE